MPSLDQLKTTFFDECDEALQQTESGLTAIGEGADSEENVNAVFRGVHSIKGGAGIFGFEALVEFAHVFETALDGVRRGDITTEPEVLDTLLAASDVLSDLVQMSRSQSDIPPDFGHECRAALEAVIGGGSGNAESDDDSPAPADFDGFDFVPVMVNLDDAAPDNASHRFAITFRP